VDQSASGAAMGGVSTQPSCCCGDQTTIVGGALGADEIEQMISDKLALLMAETTGSVDSKLADLQSWTQQLVMVELAKKQQAADAQQMTDRAADSNRYAELVRTSISFSFLTVSEICNPELSLDSYYTAVLLLRRYWRVCCALT